MPNFSTNDGKVAKGLAILESKLQEQSLTFFNLINLIFWG